MNMLRISIDEQGNAIVLRVEGSLRGPWVAELERVWQSHRGPDKQVCLNLQDVSYVDDAAQGLLRRMFEDGVELLATGPFMRAIVEEIMGKSPHPVPSA